MINRICISINNRCNLTCRYCHFHEKGKIEAADMDVFEILDNVISYAAGQKFKIGFVGNGECFLDWPLLKSYIAYIGDHPNISAYTITNGTIRLSDEDYRALQDQIDDLRKKYCYTTDSNGQDTPCQEHRVDLGYVEAALKNWEKEQVAMADEGDNRDYLRRDWCGRMSTIAFRCAIVVATLYGFPEQEQDTERQSIVKIALYIANYCMERGHKLFAKDHNRRREVNHQAEQMHIEGVSCSTAAGSTAQDPMDPQALYKLYVEQNQSYRDVERIVKRLLPPGTPSSYGTIRTRVMAYAKANNLPLPSSKQSVKSNKKL